MLRWHRRYVTRSFLSGTYVGYHFGSHYTRIGVTRAIVAEKMQKHSPQTLVEAPPGESSTELPARYARLRALDWTGTRDVMFSDATTAVRRWLWVEWVFAIPAHRGAFSKLSGSFKEILLGRLAPAA
jgi:hypothetical protein